MTRARAPPEDIGGLSGFQEFLNAMAKPRHEPKSKVGSHCVMKPSHLNGENVFPPGRLTQYFRS